MEDEESLVFCKFKPWRFDVLDGGGVCIELAGPQSVSFPIVSFAEPQSCQVEPGLGEEESCLDGSTGGRVR